MSIHFSMDRMKKCRENHDLWWEGKLQRPLSRVTLYDAYPMDRQTKAPYLAQANCTDFSWTPEEIVDTMDAHLSRCEFLGDAFPSVNFDSFGPGVLAAMCGAKLDNSSGSVWFFPDKERALRDIRVKYDPENNWSRRIKDIYRAGLDRWNGLVIMGFPDLGGVLDVAQTFRGAENLMMDMIDDPDDVLRLIKEIEVAWHEAYEDFRAVLAPQGAYTHWSGLMSSEKSYIAKIVINECRNIQRMRQRMRPADEIVESAYTPENGDLKSAIDALDGALRIPFLLKYMEGYSEKEVAKTLGITVANVKSRLLRARRKLKKELTEEDELE